jgi:hypothetical protein
MFPTVLPGPVPAGRPGLRVGRIAFTAAVGPGQMLMDVPGPVLGVRIREQFVSVPEKELAAAALTLGRSRGVTSVVVCPAGVPAEATALASLVATLLEKGRGRTAIVCGVRLPALDARFWQLARPVLVEDGDGITVRQVWELGGAAR